MALTAYEQETIINFNKEEKTASIFTYEKTWQTHLEKRLGLKPVMNNGHGGKEYQIDKKRIPMPRAPMKLSAEQKKALTDRFPKARQNAQVARQNTTTEGKSKHETSSR